MYSVHATGTDKKVSEHETLERALSAAIGMHKVQSGTVPEFTIRDERGGAMAKVSTDGGVFLGGRAARTLWL